MDVCVSIQKDVVRMVQQTLSITKPYAPRPHHYGVNQVSNGLRAFSGASAHSASVQDRLTRARESPIKELPPKCPLTTEVGVYKYTSSAVIGGERATEAD